MVQGLTQVIIKSIKDVEKTLELGFSHRHVRSTKMNDQSSRSHAIFTLNIETAEQVQGEESKFRVGKLNLVDLAGSERQSKTEATGDGLVEAAKINWSLTALGNVIEALVDNKKGQHIKFRDS